MDLVFGADDLFFNWPGIDLTKHSFPSLCLREPENVPRRITVRKKNWLRTDN